MSTTQPSRFRRRTPWSAGGKRSEAVALSYDPEKNGAPTVVAKGRGAVAKAIIEKAEESGVAVVSDEIALEALRFVDVGEEIPPQVYHMVAEILAFVYNLGQRPQHET